MGMCKQDMQALMCDIMWGYDFHVYHVMSKMETVLFLKEVFASISCKPEIKGITINRISKHQLCSRKAILASQLYCIPGVSQKVALTISESFESMRDLIHTLNTNPEQLNEIIIPYKKPKPLSKDVINLLVNLL